MDPVKYAPDAQGQLDEALEAIANGDRTNAHATAASAQTVLLRAPAVTFEAWEPASGNTPE